MVVVHPPTGDAGWEGGGASHVTGHVPASVPRRVRGPCREEVVSDISSSSLIAHLPPRTAQSGEQLDTAHGRHVYNVCDDAKASAYPNGVVKDKDGEV